MTWSADTAFLASLLGGAFVAWQPSSAPNGASPVPYPEGYRTWTHVKSALISPAHRTVANNGGFQHIYANAEAMVGYPTRTFPEGSVVVFDWIEMRDKDGAFEEGPRRQIDVMVRDTQLFASTGGWGFQRFVKESKTEVATTSSPARCFACHDNLQRDGLILSRYRQ